MSRELTETDFGVITEADVRMLDLVASMSADDLDYSEFYVEDDQW